MHKSLCYILILVLSFVSLVLNAQELNMTVDINTSRIEGTNKAVFDDLKQSLTTFMNERHWTSYQYNANERIKCALTIIVNKYSDDNGLATCDAYVSVQRPVFNSAYSTTIFSRRDKDFVFNYHEFDQLEFSDQTVDNTLTALLAYYAYLIIGVDMDTMSPLGGSEVLDKALAVVNNSQNLPTKGWKAFDDNTNRFAAINDYLDEKFVPFRQLLYRYHREGLDKMAENPDIARNAITECMTLLRQAKDGKPLSSWPMWFSEYKRDELVGIYRGQESPDKKQPIYDLLVKINASQSAYWKQILK